MHAAAAQNEGTLTLYRRLTRSGNTSVIWESEEKIRNWGSRFRIFRDQMYAVGYVIASV